jgi:transposase
MQLQLYGKKIWLYRHVIDFRCSIDGLSSIVTSQMKRSVTEGVFLFINRKRDKIKCLSWHKNGFILLYKRLEQGTFTTMRGGGDVVELSVQEVSWLLAGLEWSKMREWRDLDYDKFS